MYACFCLSPSCKVLFPSFFLRMSLSLVSQVLWSSLLDAFLRAHEKHSFFTMLRGQALDATDAALDMAKNFTQCGWPRNLTDRAGAFCFQGVAFFPFNGEVAPLKKDTLDSKVVARCYHALSLFDLQTMEQRSFATNFDSHNLHLSNSSFQQGNAMVCFPTEKRLHL